MDSTIFRSSYFREKENSFVLSLHRLFSSDFLNSTPARDRICFALGIMSKLERSWNAQEAIVVYVKYYAILSNFRTSEMGLLHLVSLLCLK